jgi:hypothetical protein
VAAVEVVAAAVVEVEEAVVRVASRIDADDAEGLALPRSIEGQALTVDLRG